MKRKRLHPQMRPRYDFCLLASFEEHREQATQVFAPGSTDELVTSGRRLRGNIGVSSVQTADKTTHVFTETTGTNEHEATTRVCVCVIKNNLHCMRQRCYADKHRTKSCI